MMPGGVMMGWGGIGGYGMGFVGWIFMFLFWGLIIVGIVLGARWLWSKGRTGTTPGDAGLPSIFSSEGTPRGRSVRRSSTG